MLYFIAFVIGVLATALLYPHVANTVENQIAKQVIAGKTVTICIDQIAYIFTLVDGNVVQKVMKADFMVVEDTDNQ